MKPTTSILLTLTTLLAGATADFTIQLWTEPGCTGAAISSHAIPNPTPTHIP